VQEVVKMHYDRLISLPPASSKVSSLRHLVDTVNQHLRSLKVLGQNENQEICVSVLWSKIPDDVLLQLQLNNGVTERWSVTNLIERLNDYVVVRERVEKKNMPEKVTKAVLALQNRIVFQGETTGLRLVHLCMH